MIGIETELLESSDFLPGNSLSSHTGASTFSIRSDTGRPGKSDRSQRRQNLLRHQGSQAGKRRPEEGSSEGDITIEADHVVITTQYPPRRTEPVLRSLPQAGHGVAAGEKGLTGRQLHQRGRPRLLHQNTCGKRRAHTDRSGRKPRYRAGQRYGAPLRQPDSVCRSGSRGPGSPAKWSAQDYDTLDAADIGRISDHSNIYVASGFRKWISNGTLAGMMIANLLPQATASTKACTPDLADIFSFRQGCCRRS